MGNLSSIHVETNTVQDLNQKELEKYLSLPSVGLNCNPLQWWKTFQSEFPTVAKLATKYYCVYEAQVCQANEFLVVLAMSLLITDPHCLQTMLKSLFFLSMNAKFVWPHAGASAG